MKEIDFYPEICEKFSNYLTSYLTNDYSIQFAYNQSLPQLISEIEDKFEISNKVSRFAPKLKLDILFGIKSNKSNEINYLLLEIKYLNQLGLAEYSQLAGYLQVAQNIKFGVLFLVLKPNSNSSLSNDFSEIIRTHNLPMKWKMLVEKKHENKTFDFKTGISYYVPNNGIDWVNTQEIDGISSFEELAGELMK